MCGTCVNAENPPLGLLVGEGELNLPVQPAGAEQGRVQNINSVRGRNHLDVVLEIKHSVIIKFFKQIKILL